MGWPIDHFQVDFGEKTGVSLNSEVGSFLKCLLVIILQQNSSKSVLDSGSFILICIGAKSNPFYSIQISVSVKTFQLKLKTVSEQKYPSKCPLLLTLYLGHAKELFMFWADSKGTVFSPGVQAIGCLVVELILLETLAVCNSSNTDWKSLSCVEYIFSFFNWEELVE